MACGESAFSALCNGRFGPQLEESETNVSRLKRAQLIPGGIDGTSGTGSDEFAWDDSSSLARAEPPPFGLTVMDFDKHGFKQKEMTDVLVCGFRAHALGPHAWSRKSCSLVRCSAIT